MSWQAPIILTENFDSNLDILQKIYEEKLEGNFEQFEDNSRKICGGKVKNCLRKFKENRRFTLLETKKIIEPNWGGIWEKN